MLRKVKRLFRRDPRSSNAPADIVPLGNKEASSPGNKEANFLTPKKNHRSLRSPSIKKWLKKIARPVDGFTINNVRPEVDNVDYQIRFPSTSELGSPPSCFKESWDNDPEIRRFL
ncbi:hypothetical protein N7457_004770 [Penicillium paradoxum]|uniref:uncharacterized protein n=1 Tax=Penicillium paradoxum TaxID=176176 RepID=UPI002547DABE|nr:uncharacterized protein N7457_004770 [Penicillium paradoxum]KAJ5782996.1 hypothetical protein N7457_004770 [Penicillium paradoxum]